MLGFAASLVEESYPKQLFLSLDIKIDNLLSILQSLKVQNFFSGASGSTITIVISVDDEWEGETIINF